MPQASPKDRPDADLAPIDALNDHAFTPSRPPIEAGRHYGITYAIWLAEDDEIRLYALDDEGTLIKQHTSGRGRMHRTYSHWTLDSLAEAEGHCRSLYWKKRSHEHPLVGVQQTVRRKTETAAAREAAMKEPLPATISSQKESAGQRLARQSFAHQ